MTPPTPPPKSSLFVARAFVHKCVSACVCLCTWAAADHGIDLAGTWQENVSVSADGTVVFAGYHGSFGKVVKIKHRFGIMTTYGHLAKINVKKGDLVDEGQIIGKMGRTGRVDGAHLHYEVSVNGKSQNPSTYIKIGRNLLSRTSLKSLAKIN